MNNDNKPHEALSKEETKEALKAAMKEWLNDLMAEFGRWSAVTVFGLMVAGLVYFLLTINGWHK